MKSAMGFETRRFFRLPRPVDVDALDAKWCAEIHHNPAVLDKVIDAAEALPEPKTPRLNRAIDLAARVLASVPYAIAMGLMILFWGCVGLASMVAGWFCRRPKRFDLSPEGYRNGHDEIEGES